MKKNRESKSSIDRCENFHKTQPSTTRESQSRFKDWTLQSCHGRNAPHSCIFMIINFFSFSSKLSLFCPSKVLTSNQQKKGNFWWRHLNLPAVSQSFSSFPSVPSYKSRSTLTFFRCWLIVYLSRNLLIFPWSLDLWSTGISSLICWIQITHTFFALFQFFRNRF